ncbi:MAG: thioredoxin domain-containing protein [Actinobacteria bacterium]|nr:thioredoxin domain-containing protein [Actinomycetota bacterium]
MSSRKEQKEQTSKERLAAEQQATADAVRGRRMLIGGVAALGALIIVLAAVLVSLGGSDDKPAREQAADTAQSGLKGIPQDGVTLGDPKAPVTIVEFADLKCPYCMQAAENVLPTLIDDYVRPGKLKIEFRNVSILDSLTPVPDSTNAATMGAALALQDKLWNYVELFYANQKDEKEVYATDDFLRGLAEQIDGADVEKAFGDRANPKARNLLAEAQKEFGDNGLEGTPSFLIGKTGGELTPLPVESVTDSSGFTTAVDQLLP